MKDRGAAYIRLGKRDHYIAKTVDIIEYCNIDFDAAGEILGIEPLGFPLEFPSPEIQPGGGDAGVLNFEWFRLTDTAEVSLDIEIKDSNTLHYLKWIRGQNTQFDEEGDFPINDKAKVVELMKWFKESLERKYE